MWVSDKKSMKGCIKNKWGNLSWGGEETRPA